MNASARHSSPLPDRQALCNWLALLALIALGVVWPGADAAEPDGPRAGRLLLKASAQATTIDALRQQSTLQTLVTGNVARVQVTQRFTNQSSDWVEGLYVFPLPAEAAVDELTLQVGARTLRGEIRRREQARAAYDQAKGAGQQASLVDQERPNMFSTAVANISPGESVTVTIAYLDVIPYRDGRYRLHLPLAITPRYAAEASGADATPELVSAAQQQVAIDVELAPGFALGALQSASHPISATPTVNGAHVTLLSSAAPADRDFELEWTPQVVPDTQAAAFAEHDGTDSYVLLMLTPPQLTTFEAPPREVIFIIDTSGSMAGPSIEQARAALQLGVARLSSRDRFNVIRFSSDASSLFAQPRPASVANRLAARAFVESLEANGGTEMRSALELAFATPAPADALRQIVFITDGSVGNETELVRMIHQRIGAARLFTVGIGAAPNTFFMHAAAAAGRGSYTFIGERTQVQERMSALFAKLEQPALTDLQLRWPGAAPAELAAPLPGDVYAGDPLTVVARVPHEPRGLLTLSGRSAGGAWVRQVAIADVSQQAGVAKLWARERIAQLTLQRGFGAEPQAIQEQIVTLALAHHLVSEFTSLLAVDAMPLRPPDAPSTPVQAPTAAPVGSYWAASTGFARTATPAPLLGVLGMLALALAGALHACGRRWRAAPAASQQ